MESGVSIKFIHYWTRLNGAVPRLLASGRLGVQNSIPSRGE